MSELIEKLKNFVVPKLKFGSASVIATLVDYGIVFLLLNVINYREEAEFLGIHLVLANTIGTSFGMITNFILQKKFVFKSNRKLWAIILMTFGFSLASFFLNQFMFDLLRKISSFMSKHTFITKLFVTGLMFFYNFTTKKFAFEKKLTL